MINLHIITVGTLKEAYFRDAAAEYEKRLGGFCRPILTSIKEKKLPDDPTEGEIASALDDEAERILALIPPRAYKVALCVEGKQLSSEELAKKLEDVSQITSDIAFIIGSSHGLSDRVKRAADMRLSFSKLTFPHQLMRVVLLEAVYRAFNINANTRYHK